MQAVFSLFFYIFHPVGESGVKSPASVLLKKTLPCVIMHAETAREPGTPVLRAFREKTDL